MKHDLPFGLFGWCFVIFVASFMPWATTPMMSSFFGTISTTSTGWNGNINFLGVVIPNWIAVVIAISLAAIGWLRANAVDIQPKISFWLTLCGAGHTLFFMFLVLCGHVRAQLGLGAVATFVAFVAILRLLKKSANAVTRMRMSSAI